MKIAFLGTPEVACIPLQALVRAGHDVALVVTTPDKRRGRGGGISVSPVKQTALDLSLPISSSMDDLVALDIHVAVVAAYGRIIPARVLDCHTFLNIHPSLLPRWRGAAPVEHTILAGDTATGVCLMHLVQEMDAGPLYRVAVTKVDEHEHAMELLSRLFNLGTELLLTELESGSAMPQPQVGEPTFARKLAPDDTRLDWNRTAVELSRVVRIDRAWTTFRGKRLSVLDARVVDSQLSSGNTAPGTIEGVVVGTGKQALELVDVRPEGRRATAAAEWANGARVRPGERLGDPAGFPC